MSIVKDFKEFAMKGNVVDLAVGVIIGASFGKIVSSLVADIVTPVLGLIIGGISFNDLNLVLSKASEGREAVILNYGNFIKVSFDFFIIAICIFTFVKFFQRLKKKEEISPTLPPSLTKEQELLTEIRDLLKKS